MKQKLVLAFLVSLLLGCATSRGATYNPQELSANNYQKNVANAVDGIEALKDFDNSKSPQAKVSVDDLSNLMQADIYFNKGDYAKAYPFYNYLSYKYKDPRIIYKAISCLEHISNSEKQRLALNDLINLFIQADPDSNMAQLFEVRQALNTNNSLVAENKLKVLIENNKEHGRVIFLYLSSVVSNDISPQNLQALNSLAQFVINKYADYPEANLLASICYSVANNGGALEERLIYIYNKYPQWSVPLYWSAGILSHYNHDDTLAAVLKPFVGNASSDEPMLQNVYVAALLNSNQVREANNFLDLQLKGPNRDNALINLGIIAAKKGNYASALSYLTVAKVKEPNIAKINNLTIATIYDKQGQYSQAIEYYKQLKSDAALLDMVNLMLIKDYANLHDYNQVSALFAEIAEKNQLPEKQAILLQSAYYISIQQYDQAYKILQGKLPKYKNAADYFYQYASVMALLGNTNSAIKLYKQYIKENPRDPYGYNDLAYIYADQTKNYKEALKYAQKASSLLPTDPSIMDTLGWVYYKLGKYAQAYAYIKAGYDATFAPDSANHLKAVYQALNRPDLSAQVIVLDKGQFQAKLDKEVLAKALMLLTYLQFGVDIK